MALYIDLDEVIDPLPPQVRRLHASFVDTLPTCGDGACAIHSVWGEWEGDALVKRNARAFLRESFGQTTAEFEARLLSADLKSEMEMALWDMLKPFAENSDHVDSQEGRHVWHTLSVHSPHIAVRCIEAVQTADHDFRIYKMCKEQMIQSFGTLCVDSFRNVFVVPFLRTNIARKHPRNSQMSVF